MKLKYLRNKRLWRALIPSIIFNFKYLPFKQAMKLPIWVYKLKVISQKGTISIDSDYIHSGMIQLGFPRAATYPNSGITWRNRGKVIFEGECRIGNDSYIIVGKQGTMTFGDDFKANAGVKIISECRVTFGKHTRLGWGVILMDTNYHPLFDLEKKKFKRAYSPIIIGDYNWFGLQCYIMHGVQTPERCVFGARSVVTRGAKMESFCVHGGSPLQVLSRNVMRDYNHDKIRDYTFPFNE